MRDDLREEGRSDSIPDHGSTTRSRDNKSTYAQVLAAWDAIAGLAKTISIHWIFHHCVVVAIIVAAVLVGIGTYPEFEHNEAIAYMDWIVLNIFIIECIIKILAEGRKPWQYFTGHDRLWNCFDFLIVILCLLPFAGAGAVFLRILRLSRLLKIVRAIPSLNMIIHGLVGGLGAVVNILILCLIVFYLYGFIGMMLYKESDPQHFNSVFVAMMTMLRMATLEDWTDVMYINLYGCVNYGLDQSTPLLKHACNEKLGGGGNWNFWMAILYFSSFTLVSSLVMMALFIGVITNSMQDAVEMMRVQHESDVKERIRRRSVKKIGHMKPGMSKLVSTAASAWASDDNDFFEKLMFPHETSNPILFYYIKFAALMRKTVHTNQFRTVILVVILLASTLVGIEMDEDVEVPTWVENIILFIFTAEVFAKLVARGLEPWLFFKEGWNCFDALVVVVCYLPFDWGGPMLGVVLRLLRVLRILKLVNKLPKLQIIVSGLMVGFSSISFIALLLVMVFYFFAIIAIILFRENDPWHFGDLAVAMLTLFRCATLEDWTDVLYINMYGCDKFGYESLKMAPLCVQPYGRKLLAAAYFTTFILIASLVMLNLFIGVVTTAIDSASNKIEKRVRLKENLAHLQLENDLDDKVMRRYKRLFQMFDLDQSGDIELPELHAAMGVMGMDMTEDDTLAMMHKLDHDGTNEIDMYEFCKFIVKAGKENMEKMKAAKNAIVFVQGVEDGVNESKNQHHFHIPHLPHIVHPVKPHVPHFGRTAHKVGQL